MYIKKMKVKNYDNAVLNNSSSYVDFTNFN